MTDDTEVSQLGQLYGCDVILDREQPDSTGTLGKSVITLHPSSEH